jgi:hypothetical protein
VPNFVWRQILDCMTFVYSQVQARLLHPDHLDKLDLHICPGINRIVGLPCDAEKLGSLVWAPAPDKGEGVMWPGQALDPFDMPPGMLITDEQVGGRVGREFSMLLCLQSWDILGCDGALMAKQYCLLFRCLCCR